MNGVARLLAALLLVLGGVASQDPGTTPDPLVREIVVPLRDGRLSTADLARALLEAYDIDAGQLTVPDATIDLRGLRGHLLLVGARKALLDTARFRRSIADDSLTVSIDRERAREVRRTLRARAVALIGRLTGEDLLERTYDLDLPPDLDGERTLVVLVHGVESGPDVWSDLESHLRNQPTSWQTATFAYPNDESCEKVAEALAAELRALGSDRRIAIVAHSMGGLVARWMLENPDLDPGNVHTLVLIGTPNHGSDLAGFRFALESAHVLRGAGGEAAFTRALLEGARDGLLDGLGEAGGDLLPGSVFLTRLAELDRNPDVHYHLVLGTRSVLSEGELDALGARAAAVLDGSAASRALRPAVAKWLSDLDELVRGQGDGAVAVASGRLADLEPELVPLDHVGLIRLRGVLGRVARPDDHPVFTRVVRWLEAADRSGRAPADARVPD